MIHTLERNESTESIEDPQQRLQCYDYWEQEKGKASYCEENFVDEILDMKYQLLQ